MFLLKKLSLTVTILLSVFQAPGSKNEVEEIRQDAKSEPVLNYLEVLKTYYDATFTDYHKPTKTFDCFVDSFYSENNHLELMEYTTKFAKENGLSDEEILSSGLVLEDKKNSGSSSGTADYIIGTNDETYTTSFRRNPYKNLYDYSSVRIGDIIFESKAIMGIGHVGTVIEMSHPSCCGDYIRAIDAVNVPDTNEDVSFSYLDDWRVVKYGVEINRAKGWTISKAQKVVDFQKNHVGEIYDLDVGRFAPDMDDQHKWYCSELVYASWLSAGVNVVAVSYDSNNRPKNPAWCYPIDIKKSCNTSLVKVHEKDFSYRSLIFSIESVKTVFFSKDWMIRVTNPCSKPVKFRYNKKMCFTNDARSNFAALVDRSNEIYLGGYETSNAFLITGNFAVDAIAAWFEEDGLRIMSYANNLNNNKTLSQYCVCQLA